jgi:beta-barrel assembly-enhancing protease
MKRTSRLISTSFLALCGVVLTVPFNMGGCASGGGGLGSIGIGGTSVDVGRAFSGANKMNQANNMKERDENVMGESVVMAVTNQYPLNTDPVLNKYVTLVGLTIASVTDNPDGNYVFGVVESDKVNAFTGPNGYIMVTSATLKFCKNEAELAGVLAHEVSHSVNHDGLKAAKDSLGKSGLTEVATSVGGAQQFSSLADAGVDAILIKGYDRDQEINADKTAIKYMMAAGYDPNAYKTFLMRVKDMQSSNKAGFFSTHPGLEQRINVVSAQIPQGKTGAVLQARFEKNVKLAK